MADSFDNSLDTLSDCSGKSLAGGRPRQPTRWGYGGVMTHGKAEFFDHMEFAKQIKKHFTVKELIAIGISKSSAYAYRGPYAFPSEKNRKKIERAIKEKLCRDTTTGVMSAGT